MFIIKRKKYLLYFGYMYFNICLCTRNKLRK